MVFNFKLNKPQSCFRSLFNPTKKMSTLASHVTNPMRTAISHSPKKILQIEEFAEAIEFNIEALYIDRFWSSLKRNLWIYVDESTLRWMGYTNTNIRYDKKEYIKVLNTHFEEGVDFDISQCIGIGYRCLGSGGF